MKSSKSYSAASAGRHLITLGLSDSMPVRSAGKPAIPSSQAQHCAYCAGEPVIYIAYSNQHLCDKHFCESVERRFKLTIRTHKLLTKGDHVAIALSGGKDSSVMLHLFNMLSKSLPLKLTAITIDEGIEGYRPLTLEVAKKEAKMLGVPLIISSFEKEYGFSLDTAIKVSKTGAGALPKIGAQAAHKPSLPCSFCGVFRRHLLNRAAKKAGAKKIAIGHNLDDMAQ
ncbi:MAG TPA: ATP-binding protein, partial [Candidatus Micrarchaeota archaeon]|nr:ATP-binding protein [Candidatus Micrarchaeota archaeon]